MYPETNQTKVSSRTYGRFFFVRADSPTSFVDESYRRIERMGIIMGVKNGQIWLTTTCGDASIYHLGLVMGYRVARRYFLIYYL